MSTRGYSSSGATLTKHYRHTSRAARESIAYHVQYALGKDSDYENADKHYWKGWLDQEGTHGYIVAWILKLGGYLE